MKSPNYWAVHGTALILTDREFEDLIDAYMERNGHLYENMSRDELAECVVYDDLPLLRAAYYPIASGKHLDDKGKCFHVRQIAIEDTCNPTLVPYVLSMSNTGWEWNTEYKDTKTYDDTVYAVWSDNPINAPSAFCRRPYPSYEALVDEFKIKLQDYLPGNFDWHAHIGIFDYVLAK